MTVSSTVNTSPIYAGNDTTGPWAFSFKTFAQEELEVIKASATGVETILTLTTDYTVSLNGDQNASPGGTVTTVANVATGESLRVRWLGILTQETDIQNAGGFYPEVIENALDKLTMLTQRNTEEIDRAVKVTITSGDDPAALVASLFAAEANAAVSEANAAASEAAAAASAIAVESAKLIWLGAWSGATAYALNDAVSYNGSSWICVQAHTNQAPADTAYWDFLAERGASGPGTGDVVGPVSATSDSLARFDGSTGKLLKNGAVIGVDVQAYSADIATAAASQAEMEAGTEAALRSMSPLRVAQAIAALAAASGGLPQNYITGLTLANNATDATNDIDIAIGAARDTTNSVDMVLASALVKRLDAAWAVGTNQGGLDTGSIANGTYHMWLIKRSDTGVVDVLFSLSATAPTMPGAGAYDYKRRIGSILRESAAIVPFFQYHHEFRRKTLINDVNNAPNTASAVTRTLSVPTGIKVRAMSSIGLVHNATAPNCLLLITSLDETDSAASATLFTCALGEYNTTDAAFNRGSSSDVKTVTNTSGQIRSRMNVAHPSLTMYVTTLGWEDYRLLEGA